MDANASQQLPSSWERLKIVSTVLGTVLIPLVIAYASNEYTSAIKQREIGQKYVELALGILSKPPTDNTMHTRAWSVDIVDHYSGIEMSREAQEQLKMPILVPQKTCVMVRLNSNLYRAGLTSSTL